MTSRRQAPRPHLPRFPSRRDFLLRGGAGFGALALADLLHRDGLLAADSLDPKPPHVPARWQVIAQALNNLLPSIPSTEIRSTPLASSPVSCECFRGRGPALPIGSAAQPRQPTRNNQPWA